MKINKIIIASAIALLSVNAQAQEEMKKVEPTEKMAKKEKIAKMKEERAAMKVAYMTKELELTEEEAVKFWPINNSMEAELKALKIEMKPDKSIKIEDLSNSEVENIVQNAFTAKEKEIEIRKKYHEQYKNVLDIKKVAKFYHIEKSVNKNIGPRKGVRPVPAPVKK